MFVYRVTLTIACVHFYAHPATIFKTVLLCHFRCSFSFDRPSPSTCHNMHFSGSGRLLKMRAPRLQAAMHKAWLVWEQEKAFGQHKSLAALSASAIFHSRRLHQSATKVHPLKETYLGLYLSAALPFLVRDTQRTHFRTPVTFSDNDGVHTEKSSLRSF